MKDWEANEKPQYMDMAYSAERSIEDEIERLSYSEVKTIVISYLIMFLYISIALGRIVSCKNLLVSTPFNTQNKLNTILKSEDNLKNNLFLK